MSSLTLRTDILEVICNYLKRRVQTKQAISLFRYARLHSRKGTANSVDRMKERFLHRRRDRDRRKEFGDRPHFESPGKRPSANRMDGQWLCSRAGIDHDLQLVESSASADCRAALQCQNRIHLLEFAAS